MTNTLKKGGLKLIDAVNGAGAGMEICLVPSSDSNPTGLGDPVQESAAGYAQIGSGPNVMQVVLGTATSTVYGVVMSNLPQYSDGTANMNLTQVYRSAST